MTSTPIAVACCPICTGTNTKEFRSIWPVPLRTCAACGARFVWPLPTDEELRRRYQREHEAGKWDELLRRGDPAEPRRRAALLTRLAQTQRRALLDVGFGDGSFLNDASEMGWQTLGLEVSTNAATKVAHRHRVAVGTLESVVQDPAPVDAVTFWDVLEHVPDPGALLRAARDRLPLGGLVAASMPSSSSFTARVERERWRFYDLGTYGHLVHMTPRHLRTLFTRAGLTVVHSETTGSVDLRHSLARGSRATSGLTGAVLDKISGALGRVAPALGRGNTLLVVGRRPGPGS